MHAAALGDGLSMFDVQDWLAEPDKYESVILSLLTDSPERGFESAVVQFLGTNDKTRSSITTTITPATQWLMHGPARQAALPIAEGGVPFDVAALLAQRASVYMLGGEEAQVAPLVCALTGYIAREARRLAAYCPDGRLDPPLSLRLDEAALICPVPLHQWSADMGGRGVSIVACFQSRAQLIDRYGDAKAATFLNNAGGKILFGGTGDRDDLTYWSTLAGERDEPIITTDLHGRVASRTTRRVPVLAPAQLANLPAGRVVVFRRDMPPVIGRAEQAWRRRDVHILHHPDALTVRLRARLARLRLALRAWLRRRMRPVAAAWRRAARRVGFLWGRVARWATGLRVRVTGRGRVTGYQAYDPGLGRHYSSGGAADAPTEPLPVIPPVPRPRELRAGPGATPPALPDLTTPPTQDGDQP